MRHGATAALVKKTRSDMRLNIRGPVVVDLRQRLTSGEHHPKSVRMRRNSSGVKPFIAKLRRMPPGLLAPIMVPVPIPKLHADPAHGAPIMMAEPMDWRSRIIADPDVLVGKPVIKGTRISVELVMDLLGAGYTADDIMQQYDHLTREDIQACLAYAKEIVRSERVYAVKR
jgi:uncharacterized protein (DUF433 family)